MASRTELLRCLLCLGCLLPLSLADDLLSPASYEGKPVAEVRFDPPSQPVARADLARLVLNSFPAGTPLHLADVRAAIKRLYATGEYSNIEMDTAPADNRSEERRVGKECRS